MDITPEDHRFAHDLAQRTGRMALDLRDRMLADGAPFAQVKDAGDLAAHRMLTAEIAAARPEDGLLSEEGRAAETEETRAARLATSRTWIVDPVDGTREYAEGRVDWAVHVALCLDGVPVVGAAPLPALGESASTWAVPALADPDPRRLAAPRILVSRSRPPAEADRLAEALGGELLQMGSAGAKIMAVVRGDAEVYPHSGGQYEWDSAAPVAVALAAGLSCSRLDGSALTYNHEDPYLPDLLVCRVELADRVLEALAG